MKLTLPQQDIYFEQLLYPSDPIYNIGAKIEIKGNISYEHLNIAYKALINQHDTYRCLFEKQDEQVAMKIVDQFDADLPFLDFSTYDNPVEDAMNYMQKTFLEPFNLLEKSFLHKFELIKINEDVHFLFSVYHHIITDGWGTSLMFQRLISNYNEAINSGKIETTYDFSYKDFVEDDKDYLDSKHYLKDLEYWKNKFENLPERVLLKKDKRVNINKSKRKELIIPRALYAKLVEKAAESKVSTFHIVLGILYLYMGLRYQKKDFAIGIPVLNRGKAVFKKIVGLFMGVSALRIQPDFNGSFEELLLNIKQQLRKDYRHQRFPLGKLIQQLDLIQNRDLLFNITLSYEKQNYASHFANTKTRVVPLSHQSERVALAIYVREFDDQEDVKIDFDYNVNYFDEQSITAFVNHFDGLLNEVVFDASKALKEYKYISKQEENLLLNKFNSTNAEYPKNKTFYHLFEKQAKKFPYKKAIDDGDTCYTYGELQKMSDSVCCHLQSMAIEANSPVVVLMKRSSDLIVTLLGLIKAGHPFIPLDPSFPKERINYIIQHSEAKVIIGDSQIQNEISSAKVLEAKNLIHNDLDIKVVETDIDPNDTAYIIYTSGSTGTPKGVEVGHRSLLNFLISIQDKPGINSKDILFSVTTQSFDISMLEFFVPLITGAELYIAKENLFNVPSNLIQEIKRSKATIIQATPSFYQMLFNAKWIGDKSLKILCGGDLLSENLCQRLIDSCGSVWNMYGPTETTIWSSCKKIKVATDASNIGKPINNTQFYIVDNHLNLLPKGAIGNIFIGGDGLAKGYFRNEEITGQKFIQNPFAIGRKIYDTGDVGKWNASGEIEFLGRNDNQVKIRGFRIELGEIETRINQLEYIKSSVVIAKKKENQEAFLIAFVILGNGYPENFSKFIVNDLRNVLPNYMIPYHIVDMEQFPLTPNKKVNRKLLSEYEIEVNEEAVQAPHSKTEILISDFYQRILELNREVGLKDNFFTLGGHSLNAVKLINLIQEELNCQIDLKTIFENPTVELLSHYIMNNKLSAAAKITRVIEKDHYSITRDQYKIWLASQEPNRSISYNLGAAFKVTGNLDLSILKRIFLELLEQYEILRTNFVELDGIPFQKIVPFENIGFDLDYFNTEQSAVEQLVKDYQQKEFDFKNDLLVRLGVFKTEEEAFLVFSTHHLIMDGWSLELLIRNVVNNYRRLESGGEIELPSLDFQFKDYASWCVDQEKDNQDKNRDYWEDYLNGYESKVLISNNLNTKNNNYVGASLDHNIDPVLFDKLKSTSKTNEITLHNILLSTFAILLNKVFDYTDICLGTLNSGRAQNALDNQIGMFVKTLPLRVSLSPFQSVMDVIKNIEKDLLTINENYEVPDHVSNNLIPEVTFGYQNPMLDYQEITIGDKLNLEYFPVELNFTSFPFFINFIEQQNKLSLVINYNTDFYVDETIKELIADFKNLLEVVVDNIHAPIEQLEIVKSYEQKDVVDIPLNF